MTATLKSYMGRGGGGLDDSMGFDNLYDVLKALAEVAGEKLHAYQATIATATIGSMIADKAGTLTSFRIAAATTGTANDTDVQVQVNGVNQQELTIDNTEADGTKKSATLAVAIAEGDLIELVVTAAPTGGAGLTASASVLPVTVES
jgi:hypothetical protein